MRDPKQYAPVADDAALQAADLAIKQAIESGNAVNLVQAAQTHSTKIGHKAFVYLMTAKVTLEQMLANKSGVAQPENPTQPAPEIQIDPAEAKRQAMLRFGLIK